MNGQVQNQNGSTANTPMDSGARSSVLLNDPTFSAIHDAFLLGWGLIELKSRVQIAAMSTSLSPPTQNPGSTIVAAGSTSGPVEKILQDALSNAEKAKTHLLLPESNVLQQLPAGSAVMRQSLTDLPDKAWFTSLWRASFKRIAASHKSCFPSSGAIGTSYDLPDPSQTPNYAALSSKSQVYDAGNIYLPYLYLRPSDVPDYCNIGIQEDTELASSFSLYDATRRAFNCLTLLYTDPQDSLIPVTVSEFQKKLVQNIANVSQLAATLSNTAQPGQLQTDAGTLDQPVPGQGDGAATGQPQAVATAVDIAPLSLEDQKNSAIQIVSNQAIHYLETWDCYARESLYVSGGNDVEANEMQIVAYEAGRALASLSWGISTATVPVESAMNAALSAGESAGQAMGDLRQALSTHPELKQQLKDAWASVFDDTNITTIQRQISALSTAMDEAYYRMHTDVSRQDASDVQVQPNLDLPSQTIRAISYSLDYWKRAVQMICNEDDQQSETIIPLQTGIQNAGSASSDATALPQITPLSPQARTQSNGSSNTNAGASPSTAVARPPAIPTMTWETSNHLRLSLIQQAQVWQPLLLCQQSLRTFTTQYVTQRIWNDFMQEFEQAAHNDLLNPLEKQARRYLIPAIAGVVLLVILVLIVVLLLHIPNLEQSLITAFVFIVGSVLGFLGTAASRVSALISPASNEQPAGATAIPGGAGRIPTIFGLTGQAIIDAFQNGYKQILIEFDYLNHNISVTYPLVEFFIAYSAQLPQTNATSDQQAVSPASNNAKSAISFFRRKNVNASMQAVAVEIKTDAGFLIKDAFDFLQHIVWTNEDRADEIGRIARAAFGPIGAFVGAQLHTSSSPSSSSSSSSKL